MDPWLLFALACPLFWAFSNVFDKLLIHGHTKSADEFIFLLSQFQILVFIGCALTVGVGPIDPMALLSGVLLFFLYALYAIPARDESMSVVIAIHQSEPLFVLILSSLVGWTFVSGREFLGFLLVTAGVLWFSLPRKGWDRQLIGGRSVAILLVSSLVGACATLAADAALAKLPVFQVLGQGCLAYGVTGLLFLVLPRYRRHVRAGLARGMGRKAALTLATGLCDLLGYAAFYKALSLASNPGLAAVVTGVHPLYVVGLAAGLNRIHPILAHEDNTEGRFRAKVTGAGLVVLGVALLG
jgi:drug/metabolite transporter (DMT)-like permease